MSDPAALYRAVVENPWDDTPRLAYADYLDDAGEPARAEFIRLGVRLAGRDVSVCPAGHRWEIVCKGSYPVPLAGCIRCGVGDGPPWPDAQADLAARARLGELWEDHHCRIVADYGPDTELPGGARFRLDRGRGGADPAAGGLVPEVDVVGPAVLVVAGFPSVVLGRWDWLTTHVPTWLLHTLPVRAVRIAPAPPDQETPVVREGATLRVASRDPTGVEIMAGCPREPRWGCRYIGPPTGTARKPGPVYLTYDTRASAGRALDHAVLNYFRRRGALPELPA